MAEYIKKEEAISALRNDSPEQVSYSREDAADCIRYMDADDVAPLVHGRWNVVEGLMFDNAICSNCGRRFQAYYEEYHFCPNCGAKMDGGAD